MKKFGFGSVLLLIVLVTMLVAAIVMAISVWSNSTAVISKHGWIALGLGTFFSFAVGCGLMALVFYSSRSGHDEAADPLRKHDPEQES